MTLNMSAVSSEYPYQREQIKFEKYQKVKKIIRSDHLAAISGILGLALAFVPVISILGILLGFAAIGFSIVAFKRKQKSPWLWVGLIAGAVTIVAFLSIIGLMTFF